MIGLLKSNLGKIPFLGHMLFSVLTFPIAFTFMEKWIANPYDAKTSAWFCAFYVTLGLVDLFRAFRLRGESRPTFIVHLVCSAAFVAWGALSAVIGLNPTTTVAAFMIYWACALSKRVLAIVKNHNIGSVLFNAVIILAIISLAYGAFDRYSMVIVGFIAALSSLLTVMILIFSHIRVDILKEIIRKTYAVEIISGLLVMMVAFSFVLNIIDDAFNSFWDALWYCFAIVTTIGFGDLTPSDGIGRILSVILGVYGIVVVALITSIIVNFYGEMKKTDSDRDTGTMQ